MIEHWFARHGAAGLLGRLAMVGIVAMALLLPTNAAPAAKKEEVDVRQVAAFVDKWRCPVASYLQGLGANLAVSVNAHLLGSLLLKN